MTCRIAETPGIPLLAVGRSAGQVAGVLPLLRVGRQLHLLRSDHSPRCDFWGDPVALGGVWDALTSESGWHSLILRNVPADSALATELPLLARRSGCFVKVEPGRKVPTLALPGFEAGLSPKFRANVRRCARKAGDLKFERHLDPSRSLIDEALAIEAMVWKGAAGTAINGQDSLRRFYYAWLSLFCRRGQASLNFAAVAGKRVACLITMEHDRTLYAAKIGYDSAYSDISPGHLMILLTAQDAERRGLEVLDFLGTDSEWKRKWTDQFREHVTVVVYRPSVFGYADCALREMVKPRLPVAVVAWGKQLRQALNGNRTGD